MHFDFHLSTPKKRRGSHGQVRVPGPLEYPFDISNIAVVAGIVWLQRPIVKESFEKSGWSFNRESWPSRELTHHTRTKRKIIFKSALLPWGHIFNPNFSIFHIQFSTVTLLNLSIFSLQGANRLDFRPSSSNSRCPAFSSFVGLMKRSTREVFPDLAILCNLNMKPSVATHGKEIYFRTFVGYH